MSLRHWIRLARPSTKINSHTALGDFTPSDKEKKTDLERRVIHYPAPNQNNWYFLNVNNIFDNFVMCMYKKSEENDNFASFFFFFFCTREAIKDIQSKAINTIKTWRIFGDINWKWSFFPAENLIYNL